MSFLFQRALGDTPQQLVPQRARTNAGTVSVSTDVAMRNSAVWACLQLRANLISTMPVDVFRRSGDFQVEVKKSPFILNPAGDDFGITDWLYSSQIELDRTGNCFGIIRARDGLGYPALVELVDSAIVQVKGTGPKITGFKVGRDSYTPGQIWHERQYTVPGIPLGLSPIAYAAMSIGSYLSAQQFALDWFANGAVPSGKLKNVNRTIDPKEAQIAKDRYKSAVANRDLFVHGADWEYDMVSVAANESQFLETMRYGIVDVARFFGVPGDLIDAEVQHQSKITYANITQRNLQFLVMNLSAPVIRREAALTRAVPHGQYVKLNTDAMLRMDTQTRETMLAAMVAGRILAPSEAREIDNRQPFTAAQIAEFAALNPPAAVASPAEPAPTATDGNPND